MMKTKGISKNTNDLNVYIEKGSSSNGSRVFFLSIQSAGVVKKLLDVFNEILCYGSTLSLQDPPSDEPCELAHLIIRSLKGPSHRRSLFSALPLGTGSSLNIFGADHSGHVQWQSQHPPGLRIHRPLGQFLVSIRSRDHVFQQNIWNIAIWPLILKSGKH